MLIKTSYISTSPANSPATKTLSDLNFSGQTIPIPMDESWRMRIPKLSRRRSTDAGNLDADDFSDVFGGPPRTIAGRKVSVEFTTCDSFYEEIFRQPMSEVPANKSLHAFSIPARSEDFYSDIFRNDQEDRSRRSRDKSSSSTSVLSSEELSPLRPMIGDDVALGSFASKLKPINIPNRWNSPTMKPVETMHPKTKQPRKMQAPFPYNSPSSQRVTSPETVNFKLDPYRSFKIPADELNLPSPSVVSSLCQDWEEKTRFHVDDDEDDEIMSSYVIEINSDHYMEGNEDAIGEAIAWAKEKFHQHDSKKDVELEVKTTREAKQQSEDDRESRMLDEDAELWSSGKETT